MNRRCERRGALLWLSLRPVNNWCCDRRLHSFEESPRSTRSAISRSAVLGQHFSIVAHFDEVSLPSKPSSRTIEDVALTLVERHRRMFLPKVRLLENPWRGRSRRHRRRGRASQIFLRKFWRIRRDGSRGRPGRPGLRDDIISNYFDACVGSRSLTVCDASTNTTGVPFLYVVAQQGVDPNSSTGRNHGIRLC